MIQPLRGSFNNTSLLQSSLRIPSIGGPLLRIEENEELVAQYERGQWHYFQLFLVAFAAALADLNYSLLVSFFPEAAESKGLTPLSTGIVICIYHLCYFITCFIAPRSISRMGPKMALVVALFAQAFFVAGMAITDVIDNAEVFFSVTLMFRCLQGCAAAIIEITAGGMVMSFVPVENGGDGLAYFEAARVVGVLTGPVIGGALYQSSGIKGPFLVSSGSLCFVAAIVLLALEETLLDIRRQGEVDDNASISTKEMTKTLFQQPAIIILCSFTALFSVAYTFIEPTLQLFLLKKPFSFDNRAVGLIAIIPTCCFVLVGSVSPYLIRRMGPLPSLAMGFLLVSATYFVIAPPEHLEGPLSFFSFLHQNTYGGAIALMASAMVLLGCAASFIFHPLSAMMAEESLEIGIPVEESANSIAILLNQFGTFGAFTGSFLSGTLVYGLGFPKACALLAWSSVAFTIISVVLLFNIFRKRENERLKYDRLSARLIANEEI